MDKLYIFKQCLIMGEDKSRRSNVLEKLVGRSRQDIINQCFKSKSAPLIQKAAGKG
jgi:hypothetical protein